MTEKNSRGGAGRNQGRLKTDFRSLDITPDGVEWSEANQEFVAPVTLHKCKFCGCVWWESFATTVTGNVENAEPDVNGYCFDQYGTYPMPASQERHWRKCPNHKPVAEEGSVEKTKRN